MVLTYKRSSAHLYLIKSGMVRLASATTFFIFSCKPVAKYKSNSSIKHNKLISTMKIRTYQNTTNIRFLKSINKTAWNLVSTTIYNIQHKNIVTNINLCDRWKQNQHIYLWANNHLIYRITLFATFHFVRVLLF